MENHLIGQLIELISNYKTYIFWLGTISMVIFLFSLLSIKWLVSMIPSNYFIDKKKSKFRSKYPFAWLLTLIIKNILGYILIIGGIMMLVLPGQGLFTIFIGLILSNYPGKYFIEKRIVSIPTIINSINWLRRKSNKDPIKI